MVTRLKNLSARRAYIALGVVLAAVALPVLAATFNLFQPAAGILKGNPSTYITTAATSADVVATFSGTCNSGAVLKGDGSCAPATTGTVTSVAMTVPSGLSVSGSPVTTSGTLAVTTALSGVVHANGSGFTASNVALGSEVSGTLPVGNGGSGATTLTGVLKGNGTSPFTAGTVSLTTEVSGILPVANGGIGVGTLTGIALGNGTSAFTTAASSNVISLWSGTCNSSTFLRADGSCQSPGGGGTVTSVGMTVPAFLSVSGSPVTNSGTLAVSFSGTALPVANGGTGTTTSTGSGNVVLSASPTLSGTITGGTFSGTHTGDGSGVTNLNMGNAASGTLAVARGGTGTTTSTGSGNVVLSTSPALTTPTVGGQQVCRADGVNCPAASIPRAGARISGGGSCTIAGTAFGVGSCSRSSAGIYQINFSGAGFSDSPGCAITQEIAGAATMVYTVFAINAVSLNVRSAAGVGGTLTDSNFNIVCTGF